MRKRFLALIGTVAVTVVLALAMLPGATVMAQATRTWVSGVGDDANPCSRTAPCKTFAGAISKTAAGGEINCLDPGGFGGVTITKSLTIKCQYTEGGVLVSGTNAIVINAAATDKVTLRGLDITGIGTGAPTSLVGIKILQARSVQILDTEVTRFSAGIDINSTAALTRVYIQNVHVHDNVVGVIVAPGAGNASTVTVRSSAIVDNFCNIVAGSFGPNASTPTVTDCGTASAATGINNVAQVSVFESAISDAPGTAVFSRGSNAIIRLGANNINGNTAGLFVQDGGTIKSFVDNQIDGTGPTVAPTNVPKT